jgi:hypothetical protein
MSDFLSRLVERSFPIISQSQQQARLSPRLPSLFEAPNGGDIPVPQDISDTLLEPRRLHADDEHDLQQSDQPESITLSNSHSLPVLAVKNIKDEYAGRQPSVKQETLTAKEHPQETPARLPFQAQIIAHKPAKLASSSRQIEEQTRTLTRLVPLPSPPSSDGGRNSTTGEERNSRGSNDTITPTVRINIGRIEVRAVHASQSSAAPRKTLPQPKMSLENYIQRRNEGKR